MANLGRYEKKIGFKQSAFIIAEISANHYQKIDNAIKMIKAAKEAGADAVKFQVYTPDTITFNSNNDYFKIKSGKWKGQTLYELYKKAYTPWGWFKKLKTIADNLGLAFFATAFDKTAIDFLEDLKVPFHKIASFELIDLSLIEYAAKTKKPIILSTGMATIQEIREAVNIAKKSGSKDITLLKCVSSYPADPREMNLSTILDMKKRFGCRVGLSDHTLGTAVSIAAVCLGAIVVEKHFTLSRKIKTPDSSFSIEPIELKELVNSVRMAERAVGDVFYGPTAKEKTSLDFRRSLFAVKDISRGEQLTEENIRSIRPSCGIEPKYYKRILRKVARKDITRGTPLTWGLVR
ncbi:MAG: pseudaminic acid synthase [Candidatus Omnitrophica bacterium]|nr:pseudaminic acid synthase [Candidatus Omnitrophota bacterium]